MKLKNLNWICRIILAVILILTAGFSVKAQCSPEQTYKLLADDGDAGDNFGRDVAINGNIAIVGAWQNDDNGNLSGSAYLFDVITGQQTAKLLPDNGAAGDKFGSSVCIDGNIAIIGAVGNAGTAYLFDVTTHQQIAQLFPDDNNYFFGVDVAISGMTAIVGARVNGFGTAYLFNTASPFGQTARLVHTPDVWLDGFGLSIGIFGNTAIVGAPDRQKELTSGAAFLFDVNTGEQIARLLPGDGEAGDWFGWDVAINGTIAVIGSPHDDDNGESSGSAYLFDIVTGEQISKLLADDGEAGDRFGHDVAINGTIAIVGAYQDDDNGDRSGSAYVFDTTTGEQIAKIFPDDGAAGDFFSDGGVGINGSTVIVGAHRDDDNGSASGSAYLFDVSCSNTNVIHADSFLATRGMLVAGGLAELADSDNADLAIQRSNADIQSRTEFEVKAVSPVANPSSLEVTLEGSVFARSEVNQTIELYDYVGSTWEEVDTRAATRFSDSTVTVAATGDLSRFVEAGTMCMKARIRYQSLNPRQQFASNSDQFIWTIGQ